MKVRGIVAEFDHATVTLMTPTGDLHSLPLARLGQAPVLGREVEVEVAVRRWGIWAASLVVAAAAAVLALLITPALVWPATALVVVEINPSVELSVTNDQKVRSARGLNDEGRALLSVTPVRRQSLNQAVQALVSTAVAQGVLDPSKGLVAVTVAPIREEAMADALVAAARQGARSALTGAHVLALQASQADTREAREQGLTVSGLLAVRTARQKGLPLAEDDVRRLGLLRALQASGLSPQAVDSPDFQPRNGETEPLVPLPLPKLPSVPLTPSDALPVTGGSSAVVPSSREPRTPPVVAPLPDTPADLPEERRLESPAESGVRLPAPPESPLSTDAGDPDRSLITEPLRIIDPLSGN